MITQREEQLESLSGLSERIAAFEQRLRAALGNDSDDVSLLLTFARQTIDVTKDQQRRTAELQKEGRRLEKLLAKHDDEMQRLAQSESDASAEWQAVLSRLNFPADWEIELAREVIDKLNATRVRLDSLPGEESRIVAMQHRILELDRRVQLLCEAVAPELREDPTELSIQKLDEQVERAVEAQRTHHVLSQKKSAAEKRLGSQTEKLDGLSAKRAALFALADASDETAFLDVVSRAEKVARLDGEIEQFVRDIDLIRAGDFREEFEQSLASSEFGVLQCEERELGDNLRTTESSCKMVDGEEALARDALNRLNGSGEVAILTEELARKRSLLAAEVDRCMPLIYARHLLNAAVSRFEKENQPEMIATVSRLLSQMTGGKYIEFDRAGGGRQDMLIRRDDGVERTPDQLSTGTREQLYLAIRLAYVLHYCEKNEPLPVIIDDVLVNFDDQRARQTLTALAGISQSAQILFFTCHAHMVEIAREVVPGLDPVVLADR